MRPTTKRVCQWLACGKEFDAFIRDVESGGGKFCSLK